MITVTASRRIQRFLVLAGLLWAGPSAAQVIETPVSAVEAGNSARTPEELSDLRNWVTTIRSPNVEGGMQARVFDARRLIAKSWPEATAAALLLLDNGDHADACIPVCRAISQHAAPRPDFKDALLKLLQDPSDAVRQEAARALAKDSTLADELAALAADRAAAQPVRAAALNALGYLADNYVAMQHLIALLEKCDEVIEQPLFDALQRSAAVSDGPRSAPEWRVWWEDRQDLAREQWLERTVYRLRLQTEQLQDVMDDLTQRLAQSSELRYRLTPGGERPKLLLDFLNDRLESVRLLAIDLIQQDIAEGHLPDGEALAAVRSALDSTSARVRRGALTILGHLRDPQDADAILSLLAQERTASVRQVAIEALAKLSNPVAIPALLDEVTGSDGAATSRMAAARALGAITKRDGVDPGLKQRVVATLLAEHQAPEQAPEFREAVIAAMASIADPALAPVLASQLGCDRAGVRRECIAGLTEIGARKHLTSILPLLEDPDPGVRLKAAAAIGRLGESEELLGALAVRLNPQIEPDVQVREAVWESLQVIWSQQDLGVRVAWALRITEQPHQQIDLLKKLEEQQSALQPAQRLDVYVALAERSAESGLYASAVKYWELVLEILKDPESDLRRRAQVHLFAAQLGADMPQRALPFGAGLVNDDPVSYWPAIRRLLLEHLGRLQASGRHDEIVQIGTEVRALFERHTDDEFIARLTDLMNSVPESRPTPPAQDPD